MRLPAIVLCLFPAALIAADPATFDTSMELQGVTFRVQSPNVPEKNTVTITPAGLAEDNRPFTKVVQGSVKSAEVADLNSDGSPEIYVFVFDPSQGGRTRLVACSTNKKKSMSDIFLPELQDAGVNLEGYRGQDEMAVVENILAWRFPIYKKEDADGKPSGGMRQLQFKLRPGEAGWLLKLDKALDF